MCQVGVVLLSAGSGRRMNSAVPKQYMKIGSKSVLNYSIECFEKNTQIAKIIIVAAEDSIDMVWDEYVKPYNYKKVLEVIEGGKERYNSVYNGLKAMEKHNVDYVMIHDAARPFVNEALIKRLLEDVLAHKACIPAVPSKDTVCIADEAGNIGEYPDRSTVWNVQTPQTFEYGLIKEAFDSYMENEEFNPPVTDDAMVYRYITGRKVKIVEGDYSNFKITTPEDIDHARQIVLNA